MTREPVSESGIPIAKHDFSATYNRRWPHSYLRAHLELDYVIPERARFTFEKILTRYRNVRGKRALKIVDVGCSYGINAALLRTDLNLDDLYAAYITGRGPLSGKSRADHRVFFLERDLRPDLAIIGVDPSFRAARYALDAGLVEAVVTTNLERQDLTTQERGALEGADLIISTGCVGYATERTFARIYEAAAGSRPWVAAFAMHPYSYGRIAAMLKHYGLRTELIERQRQRRFSNTREKRTILQAMRELEMDDTPERTTGYIYASLHLSMPSGEDFKDTQTVHRT